MHCISSTHSPFTCPLPRARPLAPQDYELAARHVFTFEDLEAKLSANGHDAATIAGLDAGQAESQRQVRCRALRPGPHPHRPIAWMGVGAGRAGPQRQVRGRCQALRPGARLTHGWAWTRGGRGLSGRCTGGASAAGAQALPGTATRRAPHAWVGVEAGGRGRSGHVLPSTRSRRPPRAPAPPHLLLGSSAFLLGGGGQSRGTSLSAACLWLPLQLPCVPARVRVRWMECDLPAADFTVQAYHVAAWLLLRGWGRSRVCCGGHQQTVLYPASARLGAWMVLPPTSAAGAAECKV